MGRKIKFKIDGSMLESEMVKVDRTKLYGSSKRVVLDSNKDACSLSDLYEGSVILPRGSVGQILLDDQGNSVSRSQLIGFSLNGDKVEKVPSLFSVLNECKKVDLDVFLSSSIKSIYQLQIDSEVLDQWKLKFSNDEVYEFVFNYREDYEGDDAFIISKGSEFFIAVGNQNEFEFLNLSNISIEDIDEEEVEIDDELDFSMF